MNQPLFSHNSVTTIIIPTRNSQAVLLLGIYIVASVNSYTWIDGKVPAGTLGSPEVLPDYYIYICFTRVHTTHNLTAHMESPWTFNQ